MNAAAEGHQISRVPRKWFWITALFVAPIAAAAAATAGAMIGDETGVGIAVALMSVIDAGLLAHERSVRDMPWPLRATWVLVGLALTAAVTMGAFVALILITFSMGDWG